MIARSYVFVKRFAKKSTELEKKFGRFRLCSIFRCGSILPLAFCAVLPQKTAAFCVIMGAPAQSAEQRHGDINRKIKQHSLQYGMIRNAFQVNIGRSLCTGDKPNKIARAAAEKFRIAGEQGKQQHDTAGKSAGKQRAQHRCAVLQKAKAKRKKKQRSAANQRIQQGS